MYRSFFALLVIAMTTQPFYTQANPLVIAHRGFSSIAPENTLAAVRKAAAMNPKPQYIEIDVHLSQDGVIVVNHDDYTGRTTAVNKMIRETPFSVLRALSAGYPQKFGEAFKNEKLPRLEEVLDMVKETNIGIMIECKQLLVEDQVVSILQQRSEVEKHIIASFDELTIYRAKQLEPTVKTLYLNSTLDKTSIWRAKDVHAAIIGTNLDQKPTWVQYAQNEGLAVWVWTVDDPAQITLWIN